MHAYLIAGGTPDERKQKEQDVCTTWKTHPVDVFHLEPVGEKQSIGIAEVREFTQTLTLSPRISPVIVGIVDQTEILTHEAQNALLKTVEEPAPKARIILKTMNPSSLLPTIISRCQIIQLHSNICISKEDRDTCLDTICTVSDKKPGDICNMIDQVFTKKEQGIQFLQTFLAVAHENMHSSLERSQNPSDSRSVICDISNTIKAAIIAQKQLSAHVHFTLVLDAFFLRIACWTRAFS